MECFVGHRRPFGVFFREFRELLHEDSDLYELDIFEGWIPVYVRIYYDYTGAREAVFEKGYHGNIIPGHNAIEDIMFAFHVWTVNGSIRKVYDLFVEDDVSVAAV